MTGHGAEPAGDLHAEGYRGGMLQPGAPGHRDLGMARGLVGQRVAETAQVRLEQREGLTQLQDQPGVHGILAGGAQVHVFLGIRVVGRNLPAERLDQRNRRIAGRGDRLGQCAQVVVLGMTGRLDGVDRSGGDHLGPRFGPGQRRLEIQHALHTAAVGKHLTHRGAGEIDIEELVARPVQNPIPCCSIDGSVWSKCLPAPTAG